MESGGMVRLKATTHLTLQARVPCRNSLPVCRRVVTLPSSVAMKDIPTEELAAISAEIHDAALRVGCTHVSITGQIWPGGRLAGAPEEAARFVEFSWLRAASVNGCAVFEETDPKGFAALLNQYGLGDDPSPGTGLAAAKREEISPEHAPPPPMKVELTAQVLPATKQELERQASASGLTVGEFLDGTFPVVDSPLEAD